MDAKMCIVSEPGMVWHRKISSRYINRFIVQGFLLYNSDYIAAAWTSHLFDSIVT